MPLSPARSRPAWPAGPAALLAAVLLCGCAETHVYSGRPPGEPAHGLDARWHSAYFFGTADDGRPYELDSVCPGGWSEIVIAQDPFTATLSLVTLFLYTPSRVTVVCARDAGSLDPNRMMELYPPPASLDR